MFLKPRWIAAHLLVLLVAVIFANLGLWQLRRLNEKQAYNAKLTARMSMPIVDVTTLFTGLPVDRARLEAATYRRVTVTGTYEADEEVLLLSRSRNSLAGHHILTPLRTHAGYGVVVDRGWIPFKTYTLPVADALPPSGEVTVTGVLFPTQTRGRFGPRNEMGELEGTWRVDIPRLQQQIDTPLLPLWLHIQEQRPAQTTELPKSIEMPRLDEGPHRSYALQWFAFTITVVVGYGAVMRKALKGTREAV